MPERNKPLTLDGLDELAKDEVFPFKGKEYTIPAISQITAEKLSEMTKGIREAVESEDIGKVSEVLKFEVNYIALAMAGGDEKKAEEIKKEINNWPRKVLSRISRFISFTMQGPVDEVIPEEEREKAKK
jgi:hypothetical protein